MLTFRRGNYVLHNRGNSWIYIPLSYPLRSLNKRRKISGKLNKTLLLFHNKIKKIRQRLYNLSWALLNNLPLLFWKVLGRWKVTISAHLKLKTLKIVPSTAMSGTRHKYKGNALAQNRWNSHNARLGLSVKGRTIKVVNEWLRSERGPTVKKNLCLFVERKEV